MDQPDVDSLGEIAVPVGMRNEPVGEKGPSPTIKVSGPTAMSTQCAAVRTHSGVINTPEQMNWSPTSSVKRANRRWERDWRAPCTGYPTDRAGSHPTGDRCLE